MLLATFLPSTSLSVHVNANFVALKSLSHLNNGAVLLNPLELILFTRTVMFNLTFATLLKRFAPCSKVLLLPLSIGPFALHSCMRAWNLTVHTGSTLSPHAICSGDKLSIGHLRIFGSHCWVRPAVGRKDKHVSDSIRGRFLGCHCTPRNVVGLDEFSEEIEFTQHLHFDELLMIFL